MGLVAILIFHKAGAVILEPGSWILIPANAAVCASLLPSVGLRARRAPRAGGGLLALVRG